jgi:uncharacterized protein (DUF2141 family)
MKKIIKIVSLLLVLLILASFTNAGNNETFSLMVKIDGLRNSKGVVQFALYNKDGTIPDEEYEKYYRKQNGNINEGSSYTIFENLPKGIYAVNALHDENMNGKIDKGFVLPIEGIGFTNYSSIGLTNRPSFSKASFEVISNTEKVIKIIYL